MPEPVLQISYSLPTIKTAVDQFWEYAHQYRVLSFNGDLGAGKTTFIHALCDHLGVEDAVSSPTFALINEYHFPSGGSDKIIYHMDWYRLKDEDEALNAGMEDALLTPDAYCFIEWPEKAAALLPGDHLEVRLEVIDAETRRVTVLSSR